VANHYNVLANGGFRVEPYFIDEITNPEGEVIFKAKPKRVCKSCQNTAVKPESKGDQTTRERALEQLEETLRLLGDKPEGDTPGDAPTMPTAQLYAERVMDEKLWYICRSMLADVIQFGTGRRAKALGRKDLAGKTGTTNDQKDAWFAGYQQHNTTAVWVGFDDPATLGAREYGGTAALPIWIDYMGVALKGIPDTLPSTPPGLLTVRIDPETGERAAPGQNNAIFEVFRAENAPKATTAGNTTLPDGTNTTIRIEQIF
jgi:penicillin-binding protein 1A